MYDREIYRQNRSNRKVEQQPTIILAGFNLKQCEWSVRENHIIRLIKFTQHRTQSLLKPPILSKLFLINHFENVLWNRKKENDQAKVDATMFEI